ncbi:MAG: acetyl-CoA hydrolase, partial [Clostridia bacterium]|nr:acetyl-CoA hydrolase [Clostridia bacterium]
MERVPVSLQNKVMTAEKAAGYIKTGMTIGVSGFTSVGYPKAVPLALAASGHAKELTLLAGASIGDEIDGALARAGLISHRFAYQSNKDMRAAINRGDVQYADYHISHFPMNIRQGAGMHVNAAIIECAAVTEDGLIPTASAGSSDALVRNADFVIAEVNLTVPLGIAGMHDIFEVGRPPAAKIVPVT